MGFINQLITPYSPYSPYPSMYWLQKFPFHDRTAWIARSPLSKSCRRTAACRSRRPVGCCSSVGLGSGFNVPSKTTPVWITYSMFLVKFDIYIYIHIGYIYIYIIYIYVCCKQTTWTAIYIFGGANFAKASSLARACRMDRGELENLSCLALQLPEPPSDVGLDSPHEYYSISII